ncbi:MAG: hypothetical protein K2X01_11935 [Cyanobacteria bacterium]|nr:hypothetical protein [Cyanobacteriota bacterium]
MHIYPSLPKLAGPQFTGVFKTEPPKTGPNSQPSRCFLSKGERFFATGEDITALDARFTQTSRDALNLSGQPGARETQERLCSDFDSFCDALAAKAKP